jgi:hypothetical protein
MYRLGASSGNSNPSYHDVEYDARNSFLSRAGGVGRENSISDEILGGSIYDPAYYSSLFKDVRDNGHILEVNILICYFLPNSLFMHKQHHVNVLLLLFFFKIIFTKVS